MYHTSGAQGQVFYFKRRTSNAVADLGLAQLMAAGRVRGDWELALAFSVVPVIGVVYALALLRTARGTTG